MPLHRTDPCSYMDADSSLERRTQAASAVVLQLTSCGTATYLELYDSIERRVLHPIANALQHL